jgi:hypothetical protein
MTIVDGETGGKPANDRIAVSFSTIKTEFASGAILVNVRPRSCISVKLILGSE